jgi:hypothetical protein
MTDREVLLEAAAKDIDLSHLEEAKVAVADACRTKNCTSLPAPFR